MNTYTKKGRLDKRSKKYYELHDLWLDTEPYLSFNRFYPIKNISKPFYDYLTKHKEEIKDLDCWTICQNYIVGKEYRSVIKYRIVPYGGVFGIRLVDNDKLIAIRNTKKQIKQVLNYLLEK